MRFLLIVLALAAIGLALTNPSADDVQEQINAHVAAQMGAGPAPSVGGLPAVATDKLQDQVYVDRRNYYLFSIFKVTIGGNYVIGNTPEGLWHEGGQQLPGCLIGVAMQVIPYDKC